MEETRHLLRSFRARLLCPVARGLCPSHPASGVPKPHQTRETARQRGGRGVSQGQPGMGGRHADHHLPCGPDSRSAALPVARSQPGALRARRDPRLPDERRAFRAHPLGFLLGKNTRLPPCAPTGGPAQPTLRTILPIWPLVSIRACAAAASASGNSESITGATLPDSSRGQTWARNASAIRALARSLCGRRVLPVIVSRRIITCAKFNSTLGGR